MSDFSDLILLLGAMVAFSLLSMSTSLTFQSTTDTMIRAELEYRAIAAGQDIIDEVRWITDESELSSNTSSGAFFNGYPKKRTVQFGESNEYSSQITIDGNSTLISTSSTLNRYLVTVIVEDDYLSPPISDTLKFIKSFNQ